jgi:hypothetical protein
MRKRHLLTLRHKHRRTCFWRGFLALFTAIQLAAPPSAYGLRIQAGLESESREALEAELVKSPVTSHQSPVNPTATAGLEEERQQVIRTSKDQVTGSLGLRATSDEQRATDSDAGMEEGSYEEIVTDIRRHNPDRFTYIVLSFPVEPYTSDLILPQVENKVEELPRVPAFAASFIHKNSAAKEQVLGTMDRFMLVLKVPEDNILWTAPTDIFSQTRLAEYVEQARKAKAEQGLLSPQEIIDKSALIQTVHLGVGHNEFLIVPFFFNETKSGFLQAHFPEFSTGVSGWLASRFACVPMSCV